MLDEQAISNLLVVLIGIAFYLVFTHLGIVRQFVAMVLNVLMPFIVGFAFAYLLNGPANYFERTVFRRLRCRRGLAVLVTYIIAIALMAILVKLVLPQVADSVVSLYGIVQGFVLNLNEIIRKMSADFNIDQAVVNQILNQFMMSYTDIVSKLSDLASKAIPYVLSMGLAVGTGLVSVLISAITTVISSIYMLLEKATIATQCKKLVYAILPTGKANRMINICSRANNIFSGFINGKILDSAIIGVLCFFLTNILRIDFAVLISVIIGVTNVIPFFGPIVGAVPCVLILLIVDPWQALRFGILALALQQFDGNILGPKILGNSTGISAFWVLVSIVVGGGLFGFAGMVLGVPTFAVIYSLVGEWVHFRLEQKGIESLEHKPE
ncbi:MAG: AI-2E family transporter [Intestinimonas massiliensis]|uniref:AI-2E family transporter n=1 Tax=Intestinimonas massiliensis (ex Afouda et al. 2020) TaxID=1673721 RepID=UPI00242B88C5|nr:AI-2E family transporter [Intestinimonas massiliensis (ex Afouda et al. 2020)]MCI5564034.1 AI-2E family transporter [Intestinimonas massiliensis (ex Afouda et al. 2020)]